MPSTYVFYHGNCHDGFGAAWAAWTRLGDKATYLPVRHGQSTLPIERHSHVYILDYCFPLDELKVLAERAERIIVLDHHDSARGTLEAFSDWGLEEGQAVSAYGLLSSNGTASALPTHDEDSGDLTLTLQEDVSGATMAWRYFHPEDPIPPLLQYVEDRDLWRFVLPESRAVSYALLTLDMDFEAWSEVVEGGEEEIERMRSHGQAIRHFVDQQVARTCEYARMGEIQGHRIPIVNSTMFQSEIGEKLLELYPEAPFAAIFGVRPGGDRVYSLRSRGDFDVAKVAEKYGGGGHPGAAGFSTNKKY